MHNDSISRVRSFVGDGTPDLKVTFQGVYMGEAVYEARSEAEQGIGQPSGLPVYVLSHGISMRFADPAETVAIMNGVAKDVVEMSEDVNEMAVDSRTGTLVFNLDADLSTAKGVAAARDAVDSLYRERRKRYVFPAIYNGVHLLDYDAVLVIRNTAGRVLQKALDDALFFIDEVPLHVGADLIVFPYFNRSLYEKELDDDRRNHSDARPENPLILVYDDDIPFESLLPGVNRGGIGRKI